MRLFTPFILFSLTLISACSDTDRGGAKGSRQAAVVPIAALHSDSITMPDDSDSFGDSPAASLLNGKCLSCHSATMVRYQPPLTREQWTAIVEKMRDTFKAPMEEAETPAIVDALVAIAPSRP
jgi:hypothetical protein